MKKRKTLIIVLAVLFVILLAVYFIVIKPSLVTEESGVKLDLMDGEAMITDKLTTFYVFEPIPRDQIVSVTVENEYGGFKIARENEAAILKSKNPEKLTLGDFTLNGYKGFPIDDNQLASLVVSAGTPIAMMRVAENLGDDKEALAEYGLDDPQASYTLTKLDGSEYTFYVGDELITEGGYYVKYKDRDAVYIVSLTIADTILSPAEAMVSPTLISGLTENNYYYIDTFAFAKDDEPVVVVTRLETDDDTLKLRMAYPRPENNTSSLYYELNESNYFDVLYSFIDLSGESVVKILPTDEDLDEYGLSSPKYSVILTSGSSELDIFVSEFKDGYCYAVSSMYGYSMICRVPTSTFAWFNYEKFDWIEDMSFYVDIKTVSRITVKGEGVDLDFSLKHGENSEGYATLEVTEKNSGKVFPNNDVANFRKYYLTLMNITNQEYSSLSDEDKQLLTSDDSKLVMSMTYENTSKEVFEYKFYKYYETSTDTLSGGKYLVTVNGVGEFYTSNDLVDKALSDAERVMNGLDIDSYGHN